eukprot:c39947_g1_i1 orf=77-865(+)
MGMVDPSKETDNNSSLSSNPNPPPVAGPPRSPSPAELPPGDRPPLLPLSAELIQDKEIEEKERRAREAEDRDRKSRELKAGLHPLQHRFVLWYTRRSPGARTQTAYEDSIKKIADFSTVEGFWGCYCHLARVSSLPTSTDFHLFKEGIRPLWEDAANRNGGKWIIRFKKIVSGRFWEDLVLAIIGDQLEAGDSVCGAVLSVRFNEDILSVWNRSASDNQAVMSLRDSLKKHLHLPQSYVMEYKPHDASLRDNSSFRNTWLRG